MSQRRVLGFKPQLRLEWRGQDGQSEAEQPDHHASLDDSNAASHSDEVFRYTRREMMIAMEGYAVLGIQSEWTEDVRCCHLPIQRQFRNA
jgi:hypothetical protein